MENDNRCSGRGAVHQTQRGGSVKWISETQVCRKIIHPSPEQYGDRECRIECGHLDRLALADLKRGTTTYCLVILQHLVGYRDSRQLHADRPAVMSRLLWQRHG